MLRFLMRYLANNEQLVQKLAESYPMRRAAQFLVSAFYRSKMIAEDHNVHRLAEFSPDKFKAFFNTFKQNLRQEIEQAKQEIKNKKG